MFCSKFALLAPVVLLLLSLKADAEIVKPATNITVTTNAATTVATTAATTGATGIQANVSTTHPSTVSTSPKYVAPHFGGTLKRLVYVTLVVSAVIGFYFLVKFCRAGRRKPRKYGVVKTPGDMEMRPLESDDDDDDEDVTMFNRKN
ncbi:Hypothetical predicted protein [Paramuricea clavata]|uniref:Uncharacterized protein n=1 Tax=Paramuricea clavata TaxID=317549 RepID=A0A6S7HM32_PARCT|nr:Hypothetical predicted protein [Paramuricea clavata]